MHMCVGMHNAHGRLHLAACDCAPLGVDDEGERWLGVDTGEGERWFVGRPHMGAPASLSVAERKMIEVRRGGNGGNRLQYAAVGCSGLRWVAVGCSGLQGLQWVVAGDDRGASTTHCNPLQPTRCFPSP